ncbi:MAG: xanthine dehydrogenase molybdopterin binding subunit [Aquabacterium sp.]|uniref:xanthine dehydrogenase molybdopterin binding subunit n=1 Tax=Aquabacterium sp. TaxID=1872578 RepID=UPI0012167C57|nr:xanthine dehydrogenase molybdopterin binding subunit [Aquabacterium sp.]TAK94834.1 MAG: xanthine dehydrogenase molybdopterin binding subunit [Aquabacterium sp.]
MNQRIDTIQPGTTAAGRALPHESAHLHVAGQAAYIDDLPELAGTLHAALGLSPVAHGQLLTIDIAGLKAQAGVVAVLTAADIPGLNDCGAIVHDDPILADGEVHYLGQPVFVVLSAQRETARRVAAMAKDFVQIAPRPALLTPEAAHAAQRYVVPPMHLQRGDAAQALAHAPHRFQERFHIGGQEQFYLEGQIAYAIPKENHGLLVHSSTQHPSEMQHAIAHALNLHAHHVQVECRRMGGGFGGKESQSAIFACVAAIAAYKLQKPVKLRPDRDDDFMITGRRHCFVHDVDVGYDLDGRVLSAKVDMVSRAGFSADLSAPVMTRALCHFDNAYYLPAVDLHGYCARTNTQSNTAFRGFGGPQGALAIELIIDSISRQLGKDPLDVRLANLYGLTNRNTTPYGQLVEDNVLQPLLDQLVSSSDYRARRVSVSTFNASNPVLKKGLALTPLKFGISFNVVHLNQAGALVHIYNDGSILVNHGGTEMGQGLNTKVAQMVAHTLGVKINRVRVTATDTSKVVNTSATAASTGSDLNGKAAADAAQQILSRLIRMLTDQHKVPEQAIRFADDQVHMADQILRFEDVVMAAYMARVQLWSDGFYATPKLHWDRETMQGRPFFYFAYGAAVSEVLVDTLTGEWKLLRADVLHDVGQSINPALDIGQIEGAFIQGMGWLTSEELYWHPQTGKLMTHAPSTYKIPTASDCPADFRVDLFGNQNAEDTVYRSKAVGEPPLLLPFSVFLAIRDAISSVGHHKVDPPLRAPATPEAILDAVDAVKAASTARP